MLTDVTANVTPAKRAGCHSYPNNITTGIGSFITFTEIAFQFRITPQIMASGVAFGLIMGALGGLFPAASAARKEILTALREF